MYEEWEDVFPMTRMQFEDSLNIFIWTDGEKWIAMGLYFHSGRCYSKKAAAKGAAVSGWYSSEGNCTGKILEYLFPGTRKVFASPA